MEGHQGTAKDQRLEPSTRMAPTKGQLTELLQLDLLFQFLDLALQAVSTFFGCVIQSSRMQDERPSNALDGVYRDAKQSAHISA